MKYFQVENSGGHFLIRFITLEKLPFNCPRGSYNILKARLFNLSYPNYLRMVRSIYGSQLKGKNGGYIIEYFSSEEKAKSLCEELNLRINKALKDFNLRRPYEEINTI